MPNPNPPSSLRTTSALALGVLLPTLLGVWAASGRGGFDVPQPNAPSTAQTPTGSFDRGAVVPDVIVGFLPSVLRWGTVGDITAYSVATTSCNIGTGVLQWDADTNLHPVIGQNMYRYKDGRFQQLGQSWLKHGFAALTDNDCGLGCQNPNDSQLLGVGCSDPYGAGLNGDQPGLGPRFEVNASTGVYEYPFFAKNQFGDAIYKRLQVRTDDVDPAQNAGAQYFVEGHYVTQDDAAADNHTNNASYREITFDGSLNASVTGATVQELPAIHAWQTIDPSVELQEADVPGDGRFTFASSVTDNMDGTWRYEYAVHNLNSNRSGAAFSVPLPGGVTVTNVGFSDVDYHSGEPWDGTDWAGAAEADRVIWTIDQMFADGFESGSTSAWGAEDPGANALRWGTMYNFWFDANSSGSMGQVEMELYLPGVLDSTGASGMWVP